MDLHAPAADFADAVSFDEPDIDAWTLDELHDEISPLSFARLHGDGDT